MTDERRFIHTGTEKWKSPTPRERVWSISAKGNSYLRVRVAEGIERVLVVMPAGRDKYRWSIAPIEDGERWEQSPQTYDTLDEAKRAALRAVGIVARQAVTRDDLLADPQPTTGRRIIL
jgi:hypothetical protein